MKIELPSNRHIALVMAKILVLLLMIIAIAFVTGVTQYGRLMVENPSSTIMDPESSNLDGIKASGPHRKLLLRQEVAKVQPNRIWGDKCSKSDIIINQGPTSPLPSGIPMYTVEIVNMCTTGCDISNIHLSCGWFSSARLVNPHLFKRLDYNDCLVNNGKPLVNGRTISFQYANTFPYPLSISSIMC